MVPSVRRAKRTASTAAIRSPRTRVMSAASMAASVPVPMARPRSACASAAASLTPSPTMATTRPSACSALTTSTLSAGMTSARTSSMPTSSATCFATTALSPVSSTGSKPSARSSAIAAAEVGFTWSETTSTPRAPPSQATVTAVRPALTASSKRPARSSGSSPRLRPTVTSTPSTLARTPWPGRLTKSPTAGSSPTSAFAPSAMARAMGCSDADSTAPARRSSSSRSTPSPAQTSASAMSPLVTVPVLSSTTVSMRRVDSSTSGPLSSTPICAPRPVPTSSAVGVARPSAHGHAMISTATAAVNAADTGKPAPSHPPRVATAMAMTMGTNTPEIRSARRWTSALPDCASSTIFAICASCVSEPTRVASMTSRPDALTVAPVTSSPGATSTGTDSPVSIDSSTADLPSTTRPSVAIFSPGRTTKRSPTFSCDAGTSCSVPSESRRTSLAPRSSMARRASPARRLDRFSKYRPPNTNMITPAATSR